MENRHVAVAAACRQHGVGKALMREIEARCPGPAFKWMRRPMPSASMKSLAKK
ncbi:GNAT family N-acetyltransferase [Acidocella sp.]|uniref:GNAT family N-acetyltransferase n=1 Tax=Acidocella sp. TaxID=50710 RepID=UPI00345A7628